MEAIQRLINSRIICGSIDLGCRGQVVSVISSAKQLSGIVYIYYDCGVRGMMLVCLLWQLA